MGALYIEAIHFCLFVCFLHLPPPLIPASSLTVSRCHPAPHTLPLAVYGVATSIRAHTLTHCPLLKTPSIKNKRQQEDALILAYFPLILNLLLFRLLPFHPNPTFHHLRVSLSPISLSLAF